MSDSAHPIKRFNAFELDATLDAQALAACYRARSRIFIANVLRHECARELGGAVAKEREWAFSLSASSLGRRFDSAGKQRKLSTAQVRDIFDVAYRDSGEVGSHFYDTISLTSYRDKQGASGTLYQRFLDFVNSREFLDFMRTVTGFDDIKSATAVMSRYRVGQFYAPHVDGNGGKGHRATYVLYLTQTWEPQWGGLLQFLTSAKNVDVAYVPRFNGLSLFEVSHGHAVSMVTPLAPQPRLSIGGALVS